jgi:hypothetical protein
VDYSIQKIGDVLLFFTLRFPPHSSPSPFFPSNHVLVFSLQIVVPDYPSFQLPLPLSCSVLYYYHTTARFPTSALSLLIFIEIYAANRGASLPFVVKLHAVCGKVSVYMKDGIDGMRWMDDGTVHFYYVYCCCCCYYCYY